MSDKITSLQNPLIKQINKLQNKARERKKTGLFVIEGLRELGLAFSAGYEVEQVLFVPIIISVEVLEAFLPNLKISITEITQEIYQKLAYRSTTEGVISIAKSKKHSLEELKIKNKKPLILIAESPEKPGNIGALLRTADAANVDAVFLANPNTDLYNPNIIRSSVGCVFTNQIALGSTSEIITYLKRENYAIFCAALSDEAEVYHKTDFTKASAIIVGTEATGLSDEWLQNSDKNIIIPMRGKIDSMNVSVAAGIIIFEAVRQRNA